MPEYQNVRADYWNQQLNSFLTNVMQWKQLGVSNVDVLDPKTGKDRGLDSIFAYRRNPFSHQEIVFVEAKAYENMKSIGRGDIENWLNTLVEKMERLPLSEEFQYQFHPEINARCQFGLIGLWLKDVSTFSSTQFNNWLSQIEIPGRRNNLYIAVIANPTFTTFHAIKKEIDRLKVSTDVLSTEFVFPSYGDKPTADGKCFPFEILFSKFLFCKAKELQLVYSTQTKQPYDSMYVFYTGKIRNYDDIRFIGAAMKSFNFSSPGGNHIYLLDNPSDLRSEIENFKGEFAQIFGTENIDFRQLDQGNQLSLLDYPR